MNTHCLKCKYKMDSTEAGKMARTNGSITSGMVGMNLTNETSFVIQGSKYKNFKNTASRFTLYPKELGQIQADEHLLRRSIMSKHIVIEEPKKVPQEQGLSGFTSVTPAIDYLLSNNQSPRFLSYVVEQPIQQQHPGLIPFQNQTITRLASPDPYKSVIDMAEPKVVYGLSNNMQSKLMIAKSNCIKRKILNATAQRSNMGRQYQHILAEQLSQSQSLHISSKPSFERPIYSRNNSQVVSDAISRRQGNQSICALIKKYSPIRPKESLNHTLASNSVVLLSKCTSDQYLHPVANQDIFDCYYNNQKGSLLKVNIESKASSGRFRSDSRRQISSGSMLEQSIQKERSGEGIYEQIKENKGKIIVLAGRQQSEKDLSKKGTPKKTIEINPEFLKRLLKRKKRAEKKGSIDAVTQSSANIDVKRMHREKLLKALNKQFQSHSQQLDQKLVQSLSQSKQKLMRTLNEPCEHCFQSCGALDLKKYIQKQKLKNHMTLASLAAVQRLQEPKLVVKVDFPDQGQVESVANKFESSEPIVEFDYGQILREEYFAKANHSRMRQTVLMRKSLQQNQSRDSTDTLNTKYEMIKPKLKDIMKKNQSLLSSAYV
ncbi:hypothetical protein FGO68_gene16387 [Halteria grandinella]|uniref:Uncharacterized protein n=1 Tax=Halteria grandinella TaxID=5974 RepID=A0A8J8T401_HALGN|nr:hypothetical protein FGO68_gene16387 [Halteria grandinella]